jgi:carbonic anhydrase
MDFNQDNYRTLAGRTSPRKNVLLLSCMDLRLLDNLVAFMNFENLENRYDQFILAGAAAGAMAVATWRRAFFDHFVLAVALHQIKYVYIVEHRDCGAYEQFLGKSYVRYDEAAGHNIYHIREEQDDHRRQALALKAEIDDYCRERRKHPFPPEDDPIAGPFREILARTFGEKPDRSSLKALWKIEVRCYMMDLRGGVVWLDEFDDATGGSGDGDRPEGRRPSGPVASNPSKPGTGPRSGRKT